MSYKTGLIRLGTLVAIALLLPTQAKADAPTPLEDTDRLSSALTREEALPGGGVLETVPEAGGVPEASTAEEGVPATDATSTPQPSPTPEITIVEPSAPPVNVANPNNGENTQTEALLAPPSTSSSDLKLTEAPSANTEGFLNPVAQPLDVAQTTSEESSQQWHFLVVPYVYIPFSISGSATFEGTEDFRNDFDDPAFDFDLSPNDIKTSLQNSLNFAFLGGLEAWTPNYNIGILGNLDYASLTSEDTVSRSVLRPGFGDFVPTELNAEVDAELWRVDLAGSYRFYDAAKVNPEGVHSEYDLGPFVFDVFGGLSLLSIDANINVTTNLGGEGESSRSKTVVSPIIGGRVRWNAAPKLAVVGSGSVSGFGISGLTQYAIQGWVDWMFSGNTSLAAGYRFSFLDYDNDKLELNVDQSGPYLNIGFRF